MTPTRSLTARLNFLGMDEGYGAGTTITRDRAYTGGHDPARRKVTTSLISALAGGTDLVPLEYSIEWLTRRPVLGGLINEYERAA